MSFKLPMNGFTKVSEDKNKTILKHKMGHEITIAHKSLNPKMRSQLKALPMTTDMVKNKEPSNNPNPKLEAAAHEDPIKLAYGGEAAQRMADGGTPQSQPSAKPSSGPAIDPQKAKEIEAGATESGWQPEQWKKNIKNGLGLADGGEVPPQNDREQSIGSIIGHAVRTAMGDTASAVKSVAAPVVQGAKDFGNAVTGNDQATKTPVVESPQIDPAFQQAQQALTQASAPSTPTALNQQQDAGTAPVQPSDPTAPIDPTQTLPQEPGDQIAGLKASDQPGLEEGYKNQVLGEQNQAKALSAQGQRDAANFQQTAGQEATLLNQFQQHTDNLNTEVQNTISDIQNGHINPTELWDSKSGLDKAMIGVGFALSGLGSGLTGGPNLAVDMMNKNIDRDIDAQKANLGKKENLLNSQFKQYGNMRDATDMTRILLNAHNQDLIKASAAKTQSPLAKAAAQQAIGKLQDAIAPTMYQMNMRRTLMGIGGQGAAQGQPGSLSHVDPSVFLNIVPDNERSKVSAEMERAQNTKHNASAILSNFDQAAADTKGLGRIGSMIKTPRSVQALHASMGPTFSDIEGTVRQAAMDNMNNNTTPNNTDTAADTALKRKTLQSYLTAKASAPMAKSYGIDLDKFQSTNSSPIAMLPPHQQSLARWAQDPKNASNPKAALVLKKLGLQ